MTKLDIWFESFPAGLERQTEENRYNEWINSFVMGRFSCGNLPPWAKDEYKTRTQEIRNRLKAEKREKKEALDYARYLELKEKFSESNGK